ncbi:MAG: CRISPR-associated RAMP protein [Bryobacterales bacterium]|nr:CRISPR-associated RAMP protein [Bryobacterales bacterium]
MAAEPIGFLALKNRYIIEGRLVAQGSIHVGSGYGGAETDATFTQDAKGPFIPGSSLRGAMRSTLERILQHIRPGTTCVMFVEDPAGRCLTSNRAKYELLEKALPERDLAEYLFRDGLCDICQLFGSPYAASKLRVDDARLTDSGSGNSGQTASNQDVENQAAHINIRHGVGIDRDTESAREHIKFDFEALEPSPAGLAFTFHIQLENAGNADFALLGILLSEMRENGIALGGRKSAGLGRSKLVITEVRYFDNLLSFLKNGAQPVKYEGDFINQKLLPELDRYLNPENANAETSGQ